MWQKIKEEEAYNGYRSILKKYYKLPDGEVADFDIVVNGDFVSVAAFTKDKEAILVRQFRPGPEIEMTSFAEGYIDENESPEQAARRELLEETGYKAENVSFLRVMRTAYSTETKICMLATGCEKVTTQDLDNEEFIEVLTMPFDEFRAYLRDSTVANFRNVASAYMALDKMNWL